MAFSFREILSKRFASSERVRRHQSFDFSERATAQNEKQKPRQTMHSQQKK